MKKAEQFQGKTQDELKKQIMDMRAEQMNNRFQLAGGQLTDTSIVRKQRRDIARAKTALSALNNGQAAQAAPKKAKAAAKPAAKTEKAPAKKAAAKKEK